ncbi:hypothetical protein AAII07_42570 [Microvirga sp. 0TCS3.31]
MPHEPPGDARLPHVYGLPRDVATFMMARAFAEVYRDVLHEPIPGRLAAILRRMAGRRGLMSSCRPRRPSTSRSRWGRE